MKRFVLLLSAVLLLVSSCGQKQQKVQEDPDFAVLSQQIWDLMAAKDADALKDIYHPNAMFVHMGGYWDCAQELMIIGRGLTPMPRLRISPFGYYRFIIPDNTVELPGIFLLC